MGAIEKDMFCCTLEEAVQMSGKPESMIRYWIDENLVGASLFVPRQKFMIFTTDVDYKLIGHAVCSYRGVLHVPARYIEKILDGVRVVTIIDVVFCTLFDGLSVRAAA